METVLQRLINMADTEVEKRGLESWMPDEDLQTVTETCARAAALQQVSDRVTLQQPRFNW